MIERQSIFFFYNNKLNSFIYLWNLSIDRWMLYSKIDIFLKKFFLWKPYIDFLKDAVSTGDT